MTVAWQGAHSILDISLPSQSVLAHTEYSHMPVSFPEHFGDELSNLVPRRVGLSQEGHASGSTGTKPKTTECCQAGDSYLDDHTQN